MDLRDLDERHEWWAVELSAWADAGDPLLSNAIEHVLGLLAAGADCSACLEEWMDENYSAGPEIGDFPEALSEEHVIRILALEDAVLVRHGLEQWLVALRARRRKLLEAEAAQDRLPAV